MLCKIRLIAGAISASAWLLLSACYDTGTEHALRWNVRFLCDSDRADSDRLHLVLRQGGCDGTPVYDQLLAPGDAPEAAPPLSAGSYGFEAVALAHGGTVAQSCTPQHLPSLAAQVTIVLASSHCDGVPDGGIPLGDSATRPPADAVDTERAMDSAAVLEAPDASLPDPPAAPLTTPCTSDPAGADARVCGGGRTCQNGACRPTASSANNCTAQRFRGHDYLFCTDALTWNTARSRCRDWGFGLVIIDDADENEFVRSQVATGEWWTGGNDLGVSDIGVQGVDVELRDVSFGSDTASCKKVDGPLGEGTWYWASASANVSNETEFCAITDVKTTTCTPTADRYQNFNPGEPDNASCTCLGVCLPGEDCLLIRGSDGAWSDRSCLHGSPFVCEAP